MFKDFFILTNEVTVSHFFTIDSNLAFYRTVSCQSTSVIYYFIKAQSYNLSKIQPNED